MTTVKPASIHPDAGGLLVATLGRSELEQLAALIVRWHHVHGHADWTPVSRRDLADLIESDDLAASWARNPFWQPAVRSFSDLGFVEGWGGGRADADNKGTLTAKFFAGLAKRWPTKET